MRDTIGRPLDRWLAGRGSVTLISEDCWGGEFCRTISRPYATPLAGAFILPGDYLSFLENFHTPDAFRLQEVTGSHSYPVGRTPYATIHFPYAKRWKDASAGFWRRARRINPERLFFKIDFGKSGYTQQDVDRWNKLEFRNAIALLPPGPRLGFDFSRVHQGRRMPAWSHDGAAMFHLSRRAFDFHRWLHTGELRGCWWNRALNFLFWDRLVPADVLARIRPILLGSEAVHSVPLVSVRGPLGARRDGAAALR